jgi:hypothetical protein
MDFKAAYLSRFLIQVFLASHPHGQLLAINNVELP